MDLASKDTMALSIKNINRKPLPSQPFPPLQCLLVRNLLPRLLSTLNMDLRSRIRHPLPQPRAPTDIRPRASIEEPRDRLPLCPHPVLRVLAPRTLIFGGGRSSTKGTVHLDRADLFPLVKEVFVEQVFLWAPATDEEHGFREARVFFCHDLGYCDLGGALLDEAAEWGDARAGLDHDDGSLCVVEGEVEGGVRLLDCKLNCGAWMQGAEVVGRSAEVVVFSVIAVVNDGEGDACDCGVC